MSVAKAIAAVLVVLASAPVADARPKMGTVKRVVLGPHEAARDTLPIVGADQGVEMVAKIDGVECRDVGGADFYYFAKGPVSLEARLSSRRAPVRLYFANHGPRRAVVRVRYLIR